jgi:hypothetical protein
LKVDGIHVGMLRKCGFRHRFHIAGREFLRVGVGAQNLRRINSLDVKLSKVIAVQFLELIVDRSHQQNSFRGTLF